MGSAASIEAGVWHNLFCIGVDISPEAYAMACSRMAKITEQKAREEGN
jgi:hypothetical protein